MSVDGPGLYQDDTAADVRADFKTLVAEGLSAAEATDRLLADWADVLGDDDVYCPFHLALADTQWRLGRVDPRVVERALDVLESGRDLERWEPGTSLYRRRAGVLSQLKKRLQTSPPAPRRVARQRVFETSLQVGDVFIWTAADGLRYLLGVVTYMVQDANRYAIVEVLDFDWSNGLSEESVAEAQPVRGREVNRIWLSPYRGTDMPTARAQWLGHWRSNAWEDPQVTPCVIAWPTDYLDGVLRSIVQSRAEPGSA